MSCVRKRCHRAGFGILLIVIGLLWFGQRAGWFPLEIFGPLALLTLGVWMIATSYLQKRQAPPGCPAHCSKSWWEGDKLP
jgi:hypothetical protein